ncbi:MAG: hypothetical protein QOE37_1472, partial [Microbacteriaceae bacterium]|nr:hypothetical protein [Microbacteriaceae bacterium]
MPYGAPVATRQPFLHDLEIVLQAPAQLWSAPDGSVARGVEGLWVSDVRILSRIDLTVDGTGLEHIRTDRGGADRIRFTTLLRGLDDEHAHDPQVRLDRERRVTAEGITETLVVTSART